METRAFLAVMVFAGSLHADTLYVAPSGNRMWSGKLASSNERGTDGPLPDLASARDRIRELRRAGINGPMKVVIRGGTYRLDQAVVFEPVDSDASYVAYQGEHPIISGGTVIAGWKQSDQKLGNGDRLWTTEFHGRIHQLFISGSRAQRSRLPAQGFYRADGASKDATFKFRGTDIRPEWAGTGGEIVALYNWSSARRPIASVDSAERIAGLIARPDEHSIENEVRYWVENAPGGPFYPGQWYDDERGGRISYWPMKGDDLRASETVAPKLQTLIFLRGGQAPGLTVKNIAFKGLDFRHTDWSIGPEGFVDVQSAAGVPAAIEVSNVAGLVIDHCTFSEMGGYAVYLGRGAKRNTVSQSEIFDMGAGGIKIGESVVRQSVADQNEGNTVADNEIHDLGAVYPSAAGILVMQSANNVISHNDVHDLFYTAISVGWTWAYSPSPCRGNIVEYNHLHNIGEQVMSDMGGVYTLGPQPGTIIRNNLIHDVSAFHYGGWGIYPDNSSSNILIENNIVYRTSSAGFQQTSGTLNVVRNNILAYGGEYQVMLGSAENHLSFEFDRNIVIYSAGRLFSGIQDGAQISADRNIYWNTRDKSDFETIYWNGWVKTGHDVHSVIADPLFVNAGAYDFRLQKNSPASALGFQPIDLSQVGPRGTAGVGSFEGEK